MNVYTRTAKTWSDYVNLLYKKYLYDIAPITYTLSIQHYVETMNVPWGFSGSGRSNLARNCSASSGLRYWLTIPKAYRLYSPTEIFCLYNVYISTKHSFYAPESWWQKSHSL